MTNPPRDLTPVGPATPPPVPFTPIIPAPVPFQPPARAPKPDHEYLYHLPTGELAFVVHRLDASADRKKRFLQYTYGRLGDAPPAWHPRGPGGNRPLYNAPALAAGNGPVLVVEGEKAAQAAAAIVPHGWTVTTPAQGAASPHQTDWTPLASRRVVIWPDNDGPGVKYATTVAGLLAAQGTPHTVVTPPRGLRDGDDLADPMPPGTDVVAILTAALAAAALPQAAAPAPQPPPPGIDSDRAYIPVGYDENSYYVISRRKQMVVGYSRSTLTKRETMLDIEPSFEHWRALYPTDDGKIPWPAIGAEIMRQCQAAGPFQPDRIRGRGAWVDGKRAVVHLGDALLVDGVRTKPVDIKSRYIYPIASPLLEPAPTAALTAAEGAALRALCRRLKWDRPVYADFLAGWISTSVICGALRWRPHAWLTGPAGCGKSWVVENIVEPAVGDLAIYPLGASSEAGIRAALVTDARPVIYDEAEGRGRAGIERRERIIELMRAAAQESRGAMFKSSASQDLNTFQIRSQFLLASIGVGLREAADIGRCVVLTLQKQQAFTDEQKAAREQQFAELRRRAAALPHDLAGRLFLRMIGRVDALTASIEAFSRAIAASLGSRREGDTLGTLLAGAYVLGSDRPATDTFASQYVAHAVASGAFSDYTHTVETREDAAILRYIVAHVARVSLSGGGATERTIGEIAAIAAGRAHDDRIYRDTADQALRRCGIQWNAGMNGFLICNDHPNLHAIMAGSDYGQGYIRIIATNPNVSHPDRPFNFAGVKARAVLVPADVLLGDDRTSDDADIPDLPL